MIRFLFVVAFSLGTSAFAKEAVKVDSARFGAKEHTHQFTFSLSAPLGDFEQVPVTFLKRTIEWNIDGVKLGKDKKFIKVKSDFYKNIYLSQTSANRVRFRINLEKEHMASHFSKALKVVLSEKSIQIQINSKKIKSDIKDKEIQRVFAVHNQVQAPAEKTAKAAGKTTKAEESLSKSEEAELSVALAAPMEIDDSAPEKDIPLDLNKKEVKASESGSLQRVFTGIAIVFSLLLSVYLVTRKINEKKFGSSVNQESIFVVSQKYLSPKRSLTLVRIAGEYMLLGTTDHNINLIKTLSIVDDEIPQVEPKEFGSAMKNFLQKEKKVADLSSTEKASKKSAKSEEQDSEQEKKDDQFTISSMDEIKKLIAQEKNS